MRIVLRALRKWRSLSSLTLIITCGFLRRHKMSIAASIPSFTALTTAKIKGIEPTCYEFPSTNHKSNIMNSHNHPQFANPNRKYELKSWLGTKSVMQPNNFKNNKHKNQKNKNDLRLFVVAYLETESEREIRRRRRGDSWRHWVWTRESEAVRDVYVRNTRERGRRRREFFRGLFVKKRYEREIRNERTPRGCHGRVNLEYEVT